MPKKRVRGKPKKSNKGPMTYEEMLELGLIPPYENKNARK